MQVSPSENLNMQPGVRFDAHRVVKKLESIGIAPEAAEVFVDTMRQIVNVSYEELVTKQEFRQEIQELRQEFKQELRQSVDEQKQYANKMAAAIIVGAPAFYAGLQFLLTFLTASKTF